MISFLSSLKPFSGDMKIYQINTIRSWLSVDLRIEIILCSDSPGAGEITL
jgi:hypothetical protein